MVDGAALLRSIEASPGAYVVFSHEQALAIARALTGAQALLAGQERLGIAILSIGRERPSTS